METYKRFITFFNYILPLHNVYISVSYVNNMYKCWYCYRFHDEKYEYHSVCGDEWHRRKNARLCVKCGEKPIVFNEEYQCFLWCCDSCEDLKVEYKGYGVELLSVNS